MSAAILPGLLLCVVNIIVCCMLSQAVAVLYEQSRAYEWGAEDNKHSETHDAFVLITSLSDPLIVYLTGARFCAKTSSYTWGDGNLALPSPWAHQMPILAPSIP